jgi:hypothetical protein
MLEISGRQTGKTSRLIQKAKENDQNHQDCIHVFLSTSTASFKRKRGKLSNFRNPTKFLSSLSGFQKLRGRTRRLFIYVDDFDHVSENVLQEAISFAKYSNFGFDKHMFVTTPKCFRPENKFDLLAENTGFADLLSIHSFEFKNVHSTSSSNLRRINQRKRYLMESKGQFSKSGRYISKYVNTHNVDKLHELITSRMKQKSA